MWLAVLVLCAVSAVPRASALLLVDSLNVSVFQREPLASFFRPKQNGVLQCLPAGVFAAASVTWLRNGSKINWALSEVRDKFEERARGPLRELLFKQFMPTTHAGYYQCLLTSASVGAVLSRPALVQLASKSILLFTRKRLTSSEATFRRGLSEFSGNSAINFGLQTSESRLLSKVKVGTWIRKTVRKQSAFRTI